MSIITYCNAVPTTVMCSKALAMPDIRVSGAVHIAERDGRTGKEGGKGGLAEHTLSTYPVVLSAKFGGLLGRESSRSHADGGARPVAFETDFVA